MFRLLLISIFSILLFGCEPKNEYDRLSDTDKCLRAIDTAPVREAREICTELLPKTMEMNTPR
jgi:hypothetical protein